MSSVARGGDKWKLIVAMIAIGGLSAAPQRGNASALQIALHDEVKTAKWMGNKPETVHGYYNGLPDKDDTTAFWKIGLPAGNIVKLERAA